MAKTVIICGKLFDGLGDTMLGPTEILIEGDTIVEVSGSVGRPGGANVLDLSDRTVAPGFIDTHVHLCVDGLNLARQTLQCSPAKALAGLHHAQQYMRYGFTTLRDMGTLDPEWPTVNLRDAIDSGMARGPCLIVAPHMISATAGHGDIPAVHTGAAEGCKQALRAGARSLEHCYLIDEEGIAMAEKAGAFLVPTMQMTREDKTLLIAGKLPEHAV
jgi:imidazolonepropionase-like amidohydrolase